MKAFGEERWHSFYAHQGHQFIISISEWNFDDQEETFHRKFNSSQPFMTLPRTYVRPTSVTKDREFLI